MGKKLLQPQKLKEIGNFKNLEGNWSYLEMTWASWGKIKWKLLNYVPLLEIQLQIFSLGASVKPKQDPQHQEEIIFPLPDCLT